MHLQGLQRQEVSLNSFKYFWGIFLLLFTLDAEAATRYVATTGVDTGNCTDSGSPCATINYAVTQVSDGDTITVASGNYASQSASVSTCGGLGTWPYSILISSKSCATLGCIITATDAFGDVTLNNSAGGAICVASSPGWTLKKLSFTGQNIAWEIVGSNNTIFEDVAVYYDSSVNGKVALIVTSDNIRLTRIRLENTLGCAISGESKGIFNFDGVDTFTIEQSFFGYDNSIGGISGGSNITIKRNRFKMWTEHGLTLDKSPSNVVIENNIFEADPACPGTGQLPILEGPRVFDFYEGTNVVARNNTVVGHGFGIVHPALYDMYVDAGQSTGCTDDFCNRSNWKFYHNLYYDVDTNNASTKAWFKVHHGAFSSQSIMASNYNLYNKTIGTSQFWSDECGGYVTWAVWQTCDLWGGTNNMDGNSIQTAPTFIDYAGLDYRAPSVSAAQVDAGSSATATDAQSVALCATEDFLGNSRGGDNGACDIGAYEFQQTGGGGGDPDPGQSIPRVYIIKD